MKVSSVGLNSFSLQRKNCKGDSCPTGQESLSFKATPKKLSKGLFMIWDGFDDPRVLESAKNPFSKALMPCYKSLINNAFGDTLYRPIEASGKYVGLPSKLAGSSEVGHNNLGAGRMIPQDLMVIDDAIKDRTFRGNEVIRKALDNAAYEKDGKQPHTLHLMTLLSDGYVHSSTAHLHEIIKMASMRNVHNVKVHAFLDGRDCKEGSAKDFVAETNKVLAECGYGNIASFIGMKYPMDRSRNWSNTGVAYNLLVNGKADYTAEKFEDIFDKLHTYDKEPGKFLEKDMPPVKLDGFEPIKDGDSVIFTNYRNDRTRQLTDALTQDECTAPFRQGERQLRDLFFVCMTEYDPSFHLPVAFPAKVHSNTLTQTLNDQKFNPWVAAETEKQAHVTYFFDGKKHIRYSDTSYFFPASDHVQLTPEMEAKTLKDMIMSWMDNKKSKAMVVNFANPDMVGHDNVFEKGVKMLNFMDKVLFEILGAARARNIGTILTADHGNIGDMTHGGHTNNPVPFIAVLPGFEKLIKSGKIYLDDAKDAAINRAAPTFLDMLKGAETPDVMYDSLFKTKK